MFRNNTIQAATLAGEGQEIFMAAFAFHAGKAVAQITAIEIAIDRLLDIAPPKAALTREMFIIGRWPVPAKTGRSSYLS